MLGLESRIHIRWNEHREGRALQENQSSHVILKEPPHLVLGQDVSPYYASQTDKGDS